MKTRHRPGKECSCALQAALIAPSGLVNAGAIAVPAVHVLVHVRRSPSSIVQVQSCQYRASTESFQHRTRTMLPVSYEVQSPCLPVIVPQQSRSVSYTQVQQQTFQQNLSNLDGSTVGKKKDMIENQSCSNPCKGFVSVGTHFLIDWRSTPSHRFARSLAPSACVPCVSYEDTTEFIVSL